MGIPSRAAGGSCLCAGTTTSSFRFIVAPPFFYLLLSKLRELSLAHRELLTIASTDPLTNCLNRRAFTALVDGYLSKFDDSAERGQGALFVLDVDHFKAVNDKYGHDCGDEALIPDCRHNQGQTFGNRIWSRDWAAKSSPSSCPGSMKEKAIQAAERIRLAVRRLPHMPKGESHPLSLSIGGVTFRTAGKLPGPLPIR